MRKRISSDIIQAIKDDVMLGKLTTKAIAEKYNVSVAAVYSRKQTKRKQLNNAVKTEFAALGISRYRELRAQAEQLKHMLLANGVTEKELMDEGATAVKSSQVGKLLARGNYLDLEILNQKELDMLVKIISEQPEFPKIKLAIDITGTNENPLKWLEEFLNIQRKSIEVELSKTILMIHALETNNFDDLPPSAIAELEKMRSDHEEKNPKLLPEKAIT